MYVWVCSNLSLPVFLILTHSVVMQSKYSHCNTMSKFVMKFLLQSQLESCHWLSTEVGGVLMLYKTDLFEPQLLP